MTRIATFNANSIRSRLEIVLEWLDQHQPDVLCIQETKAQDQDFPRAPFEAKGWHVVFKGQKAYNGVAIVSKKKPDKVRLGFQDDEPSDETRLIYARVAGLHVVNTYVPQGREIEHEMYAYKLRWFDRLRRYFDQHFTPRARLVWLGDMNVAPTPIDVHNPDQQKNHVCYHEDVRQAFERTVAWGFVDVFRRFHADEAGQFSFFDYRVRNAATHGKGWRIDHILASRALASKAVNSFIDLDPRNKPKPSDHTFVVADFDT